MMIPNQTKIESLFYKLSLATAISVLLFSVLNGYGFINIIIRTALAFIFIYFLGQALLVLWQSISPPPRQAQDLSHYLDVMVGEDMDLNNISEVTTSTDKRADSFPGQIRMDIKNDLQEDNDTKAEMVRRMGWEDTEK